MRADRLLSLLLLLQARGRLTAPELARELEVSERTIYRDINALNAAGVPVYGEAGPQGGYALLESYRTNLTGLTPNEVRALFMLSIPAPLEALGVSAELRSALRKLAAALPAARSHEGEQIRRRFYLDSTWWDSDVEAAPYLPTLHQAVVQDRKIIATYRLPTGVETEHLVEPYGLVAKAGDWYLAYARKGVVQAQRVAHLLDVRLTDATFVRPADFDLETFWRAWCAGYAQRRSFYVVRLRVAPHFRPALPWYFGDRIRSQIDQADPPDAEGWLTLELTFESLAAARDRILACGNGVEVLEPLPLRRSLLDYAEQIVARYTRQT